MFPSLLLLGVLSQLGVFQASQGVKEMRLWVVVTWLFVCGATALAGGEQPLSRIAIERTVLAVDDSVHVKASPLVLGLKVT
jgi:hypothetical protein